MSGLETFETLENFESFETFDGSRPNLVNNKLVADIEARLKLNAPSNNNSNKVINGLGTFYNDYILPNLFPIIVISLLIIYLTIKYILKRDREEKAKQAKNTHKPDSKLDNKSDKKNEAEINSELGLELSETLAKAKQHMLKVNLDDHNNPNDIHDYINDEKEYNDLKNRHLESVTNKKSVSDMISDDYLLTDSEINNDNANNDSDANENGNDDPNINIDNDNDNDGINAINNSNNEYNKNEREKMLELEESFRWGIDRGGDKKMDDVARMIFGNQ